MSTREKTPFISVIIPTYNRADLLKLSLKSLAKQGLSYQDYEIIVIDDGSQDHTKDVCKELQKSLPLQYFYQGNSGIATAKNLGIFTSRAPILFFFDDDDVAAPDLLTEHLKKHKEHPQENVAVLGFTRWSPTLPISQVMHFVTDIGQFLFSYSQLKHDQELDFTYFWGGRSSCKRSLLAKHGIFRQEFRFGSEDIELGYRLSKFGFKVIFNRKAVSYMIRPLTYDEFCRRCERQGKSQYVFSRIHPDPFIQNYCLAIQSEEKWSYIEKVIEKKVRRVHEIESLYPSGAAEPPPKPIADELTNLYWWTFNAYKIKGFVKEMHIQKDGNDTKDDHESKVSKSDLEYLNRKWIEFPKGPDEKKSILVIDPYLPMYDRASGSLRLFQILKALLKIGYHVTFIARDDLHAKQYLPLLRDIGIETYAGDPLALDAVGVNIISSYLNLEKILTERNYQAVVLDFWNLAEYYLPIVRKYSPTSTIIIDSVDIHFLREIREAELKNDQELKQKAFENKDREIAIYSQADRIWVVTSDDKKVIENIVEKVPIDIIPNVHEKIEAVKIFEETSDLLFVGNFNHKPNIDAAHFLCQKVFPLIQRKLRGVKLFVVGNNPPDSIKALASDHIIVTGYVEDLSSYLKKARISVSPLRYGAGMKGKVGEALAWGLPVVTTTIGAEGMGLVDGREALIADEAEQFAMHVVELYNDKERWNKLSQYGKKRVESEWSPDAIKARLEGVLQSNELSSNLVSIIILTFNQLPYTKECIASIQAHTSEPHEIIFIDNGSTDGTVQWLKTLVKKNANYKLVENRENLGFSKGCNQGIRAAAGEYILLLNNDVVVTENWLAGMRECLRRAPDVGIVGPMTNNISGLQKVVDADYCDISDLGGFAKAFRERNRHRRIPVRRVVGFCLLFKRELVDQIGLLDERFGSGNFEDDDFCLRAALEGYRNFIAGDVFIHHYGSQSFIGNRIDYQEALFKNKKLFNEKWNGIDVQSSLGQKALSLKAMEKAEDFNHKGQQDKAIATLAEGIKYSSRDRKIYFTLVEMFLEDKKYKDALSVLEKIPGEEKDEKWLILAAYCAEGLERYDQAQENVSRALALNPSSPAALNLKGILTYKKGDTPAAEGFLRQALEIDPGYGEPYANLGVIKWAAGSQEDALPFLEKGFILSPTATDIITLYHSAITSMGEFVRAEKAYEEAKGVFPLNRRITFLWIDVLLRQGKNEEAMNAIEQAIVTFGLDDDLLHAALEIRNRIGVKEISKKPTRKDTISLCMIVKDEEQNLPQCLQNAAPIVDEMIVVDTGSKDKTKDIAKVFGAKVYDLEWTGSFATARNFSITKASGKWILVLDADEIISRKDYSGMEKLFKKSQNGSVAFSFTTRNYIDQVDVERWEANHGEYGLEEAGIGWLPSEKTRLFPRDRRIGFENPVHEIVEPSLKKGGIKIIKAQAPIHHYGKLNKEKMKVKGQIYYELGKRKLSERENNLEALKELAIQANELKKYEEAVGLWQKVISLQPAMPSAFLNLGHAFLELGKYAEALTASARACELGPNMKEAAYNRSLCEICAGDLQNAISSLDTLLQKDPGYPPAIGLRGVAFFLEGKIEKGIESLERIKKMGANVSDVLAAHVSRLLRAGKEEYALSLLQAAAQSKSVNKEISALLTKLGKAPASPPISNSFFSRGSRQEEQARESSK